jgi:hypothetical protein
MPFLNRLTRHAVPALTPTEIICGDCAGDDLLPRRTKLTVEGSCAKCGGRSYALASLVGVALACYLRNNNTEINTNVTESSTEQNYYHSTRAPESGSKSASEKLRLVG